jgi:hypothetical protein
MTPRLNRTDAWFIAALPHGKKATRLADFINNADYVNRLIPTFDEARYSFARLAAAGYVVVGRDERGSITIQSTDRSRELQSRAGAGTLGGFLAEVASLVNARPYPEAEDEDRSLGPIADLSESEWDTAVRDNADWMEQAARKFLPGFVAPGSSRDIRRR